MTFVPTIPDKSRVWGCDVSFYQDDNSTPQKIDFAKMKEGGASFVFIRAGQNKWKDPDFMDFWRSAKLAGIPRGAYYYLDSRASMKDQARILADGLFMDPGELPYAPDFEQISNVKAGIPTQLRISHLNEFYNYMREFMPTYKKVPIIYTGYYFWRDFGSAQQNYANFPVWLARYKATEPLVPPPWKTWNFWQFADTGPGKELGCESNAVDLNYFNGTAEQFQEFIGNTTTGPDPEPDAPRKAVKITYNDGTEQVIP